MPISRPTAGFGPSLPLFEGWLIIYLFFDFCQKKRGVCTAVFLKRGLMTRQKPENDQICINYFFSNDTMKNYESNGACHWVMRIWVSHVFDSYLSRDGGLSTVEGNLFVRYFEKPKCWRQMRSWQQERTWRQDADQPRGTDPALGLHIGKNTQ